MYLCAVGGIAVLTIVAAAGAYRRGEYTIALGLLCWACALTWMAVQDEDGGGLV